MHTIRLAPIKPERVTRRRYLTMAQVRADLFDYIERFHHSRMQRRLGAQEQPLRLLPNRLWERG